MSAADNTMRAEFEAAVLQVEPGLCLDRTRIDGAYLYSTAEIAWATWQAARAGTARMVADAVAAEREACLQACREVLRRQLEDEGLDAAGDCCDAIRARSTTPDAGEQR